MDPPRPPPETSDPAIGAAANPSDPAPLLATAHTHPPYDEMIFAAMAAVKSAAGSSKEAISDYIEQTYPSLPANHSALLSHHLRSLKASGRIVMSKNSYQLPQPEGNTSRKRGRPPKSKAVPGLVPRPVGVPAPKPVVLGLSDDAAPMKVEAAEHKPWKWRSGRGRPARRQKSRPLEEVVLPANGAGRPKRGRGRPPKLTMVPFASEGVGSRAEVGPQDQQKVGAVRVEKLPVRRQGQPPRSNTTAVGPADQPKPSDLSAAVADQHVHGVDYEILQKKVEIIQRRIKDAVAILKPHLVGDASTNVMAAIIELEAIAALDVKAPLTVDLNVTPS